ncbi:MAG: restriction endonuclease [Myxococcaceae bacterium]
MALLILGIGAVVFGFGLLLLISLTSPRMRSPSVEAAGGAAGGFIAALGADELGRLLTALLEQLGFEDEDLRVSKGMVDILAVSHAPVTGGRLYVRGVPTRGEVGAEEVRSALEAAGGEAAGRALVATGGTFSAEARAAAEGGPVELLDGAALLALVTKHLPAMAAAGRVLN